LQLTARGGDVSRSRDTGQSIPQLTSGQFDTEQNLRAKIVCELLTSERDYVKLLRDIIEVYMHRDSKIALNRLFF